MTTTTSCKAGKARVCLLDIRDLWWTGRLSETPVGTCRRCPEPPGTQSCVATNSATHLSYSPTCQLSTHQSHLPDITDALKPRPHWRL